MYGGASAEVEVPVPFLPQDWGLSVAAWADGGYVAGVPGAGLAIDPLSVDNPFKASVGGSIIWDSFIGPIRGDFAYVLSQATRDATQVFQLSLSSIL
jgi:outer membrane protein insertion porin family